MLRRWFVEEKGETNAYRWDQNDAVVEWLEEQKKNELSIVNKNINAVRRDAIISQIQRSLAVKLKPLDVGCIILNLSNFNRNVRKLRWKPLLDFVKLCHLQIAVKSFEHWLKLSLRTKKVDIHPFDYCDKGSLCIYLCSQKKGLNIKV